MNTSLSERIARGLPAAGSWISIGSPVVTELAGEFDLDWLLLDLEHGCFTEAELMANLQAMRGSASVPIVRVPGLDIGLIGRVLDRGAHGVMAPHICSANEAETLVKATRYPPRGERGFSRTVRAYGYGLRPPALAGEWSCTVMVQIENLEGVEQVDAIAAVEGVDVLFVGPADLAHDLSARGAAKRFDECLQRVARAAKAHGKQSGILVRNDADMPKLKELGYTVLALDSDLGMLRKGYEELAKRLVEAGVRTPANVDPV